MIEGAEQERVVCDRLAPDGSPYVAFLSGPSEIALRLPGQPGKWILLTVNSGRPEDAIATVLALRVLHDGMSRTAAAAAALVRQRLDQWPSPPRTGQDAGRWSEALWKVFKFNLAGEVADIDPMRLG
jgi:hypothetical protein